MNRCRAIITVFFTIALLLGSGPTAAVAAAMRLGAKGSSTDAAEAIISAVRQLAPGMLSPLVDYSSLDLEAAKCSARTKSTTRAILVGASHARSPNDALPGPENDVELLAASLEARGVGDADIIRLAAHSATREALAQAFVRTLEKSQCGDRVIVHFSGIGEYTDRFLSNNVTPIVQARIPRAPTLAGAIERLGTLLAPSAIPKDAAYAASLLARLRYIEEAGLILFLAARSGYPLTTEISGKPPAETAGGSPTDPAAATVADVGTAADPSEIPGRPPADPAKTTGRGPIDAGAATIADVVTAADLSEFVSNVRNRGADAFLFLDVANAAQAKIADRQAVAGDTTTWVYETGDYETGSEEIAGRRSATRLLGARASYAAFYASLDDNNFEGRYGGSEKTLNGVFTYRLAIAIQNKNAVTVRELAESLAGAAKSDSYGRRQKHRIEGSDADSIVFTDSSQVRAKRNPIVITSPNVEFRGPVPVDRPIVELTGAVEWNAALAGIQVNGKPALVNPDGTFSASIELDVGRNPIEVVAYTVDRKTHVRNLEFVFDGNLKELAGDARRYALLIANQNYGAESGFAPLSTPKADVARLKSILEEKYGFATTAVLDGETVDLVLEDATQDEIGIALDQLNLIVRENDTVMIYYAGHGVVEQNETTIAYWVPSDARNGRYSTYVDAAFINRSIARMKARKVVVVSDSCYSGALVGRGDYQRASEIEDEDRNRVLMGLTKDRTRILLSSGNVEPVPDNEGNGHSVFANAFAEGLNSMAHEAFTARELFDGFILEPVMQRSQQEPQYKPIYESGHKGGDVIFVRLD